jgi:hypothetical protein
VSFPSPLLEAGLSTLNSLVSTEQQLSEAEAIHQRAAASNVPSSLALLPDNSILIECFARSEGCRRYIAKAFRLLVGRKERKAIRGKNQVAGRNYKRLSQNVDPLAFGDNDFCGDN